MKLCVGIESFMPGFDNRIDQLFEDVSALLVSEHKPKPKRRQKSPRLHSLKGIQTPRATTRTMQHLYCYVLS